MLEILLIIVIVVCTGLQILLTLGMLIWCYYQFKDLFIDSKIEQNSDLESSYSNRYVHFTDSAIKVDVARYLKSPEGKRV